MKRESGGEEKRRERNERGGKRWRREMAREGRKRDEGERGVERERVKEEEEMEERDEGGGGRRERGEVEMCDEGEKVKISFNLGLNIGIC
jgi:hypothetical protein